MQHYLWWNEEQKKLAKEAKKVTDEILIPMVERCVWKKAFPREAIREIGKRGWFGSIVPEEYGGRVKDWGITGACIVTEELGRCGGIQFLYCQSLIGGIIQLVDDGNDDQKDRWLPRLAKGELLGVITMTEPYAGSDISGIESTALRDGDYYILNGKKRYQTNVGSGDIYMSYFKTSDKPDDIKKHNHLTAFIIEKGTPGFSVERINDLMGLEGIYNGYLNFENVRIPILNRIGEEGKGWQVMMKGLNVERTISSALVLGGMREGLRYAHQHLHRRVQFRTLTGDVLTNQFKFVDLIADLSTARLGTYYTAYCADKGYDVPVDAASTKLFNTTAAMKNAIDGIQMMGGNGVTKYYPVERFLRDAKLIQIAAGTDEILRLVMYRMGLNILAEDLKAPVRAIDPELHVPMPLGKFPSKQSVSS
jgi:acyl-CoA dehydrogenase